MKTYLVTEEDLRILIEKLENKITTTLRNEGVSSKIMSVNDSVADTIKTYLKKYCSQ